jgi:hypothetical protein
MELSWSAFVDNTAEKKMALQLISFVGARLLEQKMDQWMDAMLE